MGIVATVVQFLSFFTILTNILVAICFTLLLLQFAANNFFIKPKTMAATAVYITVVAAIYNIILRYLWSPTDWQLLADNLLHVVVPALFVGYWLFAVPKKDLRWKDSLYWLIYPFIYLIYTVIRGAITNLYPYPFADVTTYGYAKVLTNGAIIMILFLLLSLAFIGLGKLISRSTTNK